MRKAVPQFDSIPELLARYAIYKLPFAFVSKESSSEILQIIASKQYTEKNEHAGEKAKCVTMGKHLS